ncbi:MAG TPA: hypothetical protein PLE40_01825 [Candidatus Pacearchaeota archaeon]|nr:hypothetical protein [Candidatus Paceibacterota bacterium]HOK00672.1 hypothetical protein [Candidatus Pacearchaeota archaeon]HOL90494.1 hypothetical protein [Candidatus Pacearchaeota archaeon]HPO68465.1 hypothetical protein [Candidatus Pacearchaeota archaeon]
MEIIFFIFLLLLSFLGIIFFIIKKIPDLSKLVIIEEDIKKEKNNKKFLKNPFIGFKSHQKKIQFEKILQKILLKAKIRLLKIENKIGDWINYLKNRSASKKDFSENYWQKIQKSIKKKK